MSSANTSAQGDANAAAGDVAGGVVPLRTLGDRMLDEARAAHSGRAGRTIIALPGLRTTLLALAAGSELAEHQAPGSATIVCLSGEVTLAAGDREWRLRADDAVAIPEERHRLLAEADALVLLTVRLD